MQQEKSQASSRTKPSARYRIPGASVSIPHKLTSSAPKTISPPASNRAWIQNESLPVELRKVKLYESAEHRRNFLDGVKSRKPTITPVETAHHSTLPGHLGLISMLVGRKIQWDVAQEKILNDGAATELLTRPYRAPWQFPG